MSYKAAEKYNVVKVREKRYNTDLQGQKMQTSEYVKLTNQRAGVEGIPSVLRRRYRIDSLPVNGTSALKIMVFI